MSQQSLEITRKEKHELFEGEFSAEQAKEIATNILDKNIRYFRNHNFGQIIRKGEECSVSQQYVEQMENMREQLLSNMKQLAAEGQKVRIQSQMVIEVIDPKL